MQNSTTWVGMDVHKERIHVVAVNEAGHTEAHWETPNTPKGKGRMATRLAGLGKARCVYEAGSCGYDLARFLPASNRKSVNAKEPSASSRC